MFDTGVGIKNPLFFVGVIEDILDPRQEGRVKVRAFGVHGYNSQIPTESLPWALVVHGDYNPNKRLNLNDWVFGVFLDGREAQQPMVLGLIPTQMTEVPNPEADGYGTIPSENCDLQLGRNAAENFGQPGQSRLHRGEHIRETYVDSLEAGRVRDVEGARYENGEIQAPTWSEPPAAYNAQYPYNYTIETAKHSIEVDDTPGAERIMIHHNSGSYIQIDHRGTTTHKSAGDKYEVNDAAQHVVIGNQPGAGMSTVTINGNSYVRVNGNKVEEVTGDYTTVVRGRYTVESGLDMELNTGQIFHARGGIDARLAGMSGTVSIKGGDEVQIEAGRGYSQKAPVMMSRATKCQVMEVKPLSPLEKALDALGIDGIPWEVGIPPREGGLFIESTVNTQFRTLGVFGIDALGTLDMKSPSTRLEGTETLDLNGAISRLGGSGVVHIKGTTVNIDDFVSMANGAAEDSFPAVIAIPTPTVNVGADISSLPEPAASSTSIVPQGADPSSITSSGISSQDDQGE